MKAVLHEDVGEFLLAARQLYEADPVRHTVALSVLTNLPLEPGPQERRPLLVTVHDNDGLRGATFRTPPWFLGVSGLPADCAPAVATVLAQAHPGLPGVTGPVPEAEAFASAWSATTGCGMHTTMSLRLYRLGELVPPGVAGGWRLATERDVSWLGAWTTAFMDEAQGGPNPLGAEESVRRSLAIGDGNVVWEDGGRPVAWAKARRPVAGTSRIGPVYTPPEHRGHGYGSAVTAHASLWSYDAGAREVVLFADLANPVSNSIYQRIGYRCVFDAVDIEFSAY